jgi:hypothetical protein
MANYHLITIILAGEVSLALGDIPMAVDQLQFAIGEAQFVKNPWLELKSQAHLQKAYQMQGKNSERIRTRIEELLDQIDNQITDIGTQRKFQALRTQFNHDIRLTSDTL